MEFTWTSNLNQDEIAWNFSLDRRRYLCGEMRTMLFPRSSWCATAASFRGSDLTVSLRPPIRETPPCTPQLDLSSGVSACHPLPTFEIQWAAMCAGPSLNHAHARELHSMYQEIKTKSWHLPCMYIIGNHMHHLRDQMIKSWNPHRW